MTTSLSSQPSAQGEVRQTLLCRAPTLSVKENFLFFLSIYFLYTGSAFIFMFPSNFGLNE